MPHISRLADNLPQSAIRALTPFAEKAEADGVKVYHLNIGAPDIKSPRIVVDAVHNYKFDHLPYSNSLGTRELRQAFLDKYYNKLGLHLSMDDILVTTAGSEALDFFFQITTNPGEEVIVFEPFYVNYNSIALKYGIKLVPIHTDIREGFRLPPVEEIEKAVTPRTRAVLISNPSNPTGTVFDKQELLAIAGICRKYDLFLGSDEVYREFCYSDQPIFSVMEIEDFDEYGIMLDSVSKRYNLCGARIGTIASRNKEVMNLGLRLAQARLCPPVLAQAATLAALDAPESYFEETRREYISRRNFTVGALNRIPGVFSPMPNEMPTNMRCQEGTTPVVGFVGFSGEMARRLISIPRSEVVYKPQRQATDLSFEMMKAYSPSELFAMGFRLHTHTSHTSSDKWAAPWTLDCTDPYWDATLEKPSGWPTEEELRRDGIIE